jgi:ribosomal protein L9
MPKDATAFNKQRRKATRANHLAAAARRKESSDYTQPLDERREDGAIKVRKGTVIRHGTQRHRAIISQRQFQQVRIAKKRDARRRFTELDTAGKDHHRTCGFHHTKPRDLT